MILSKKTPFLLAGDAPNGADLSGDPRRGLGAQEAGRKISGGLGDQKSGESMGPGKQKR